MKEVYAQAVADLRKGEKLMTAYTSAIYASRYSAQALLSKVYAYMSDTYESPNLTYADSSYYYANEKFVDARAAFLHPQYKKGADGKMTRAFRFVYEIYNDKKEHTGYGYQQPTIKEENGKLTAVFSDKESYSLPCSTAINARSKTEFRNFILPLFPVWRKCIYFVPRLLPKRVTTNWQERI